MQTSRLAGLARTLGILALVCAVVGPALSHFSVVPPIVGFAVFGLGGLVGGALALICGLLGLVFTRASAYRGGRRHAWLGTLLGALVVAVIAGMGSGGRGVPAINDITTNPADPPAFASDPWKKDRDMKYPAGFAEVQRAGYPDLAPIVVAMPPAAALDRVASLFATNGWVVTSKDPVSNTLTATDTSHLFRFVDDIVVRVRPQDGGAVVDMRSKSRVGRGDMGANAARIRKLTAELKSAS